MNNIEFGKMMQELAEFFNKQTGQTLDVSYDEETGYLSSTVYNGTDYPRDRVKRYRFLRELVIKSMLDKTPFVIEPMIVNEKIVNSSFCFKDKDGHYFPNLDFLTDDNSACTIPYYFFELFIDYFKSNKTDKIDYWIEQDGIITFSIENNQMTITLDNFKDKRKYIVDGTLNQIANDLIRHFKNYEKEYENAYNVSDKSEFTTTKNLCNELKTLLINK